MEDLATSVAVALRAEKLIFLSSSQGVLNDDGTPDTELARVDADALLAAGTLDEETSYFLQFASLAVKRGVARSHLLPFRWTAACCWRSSPTTAWAPWWSRTRWTTCVRPPSTTSAPS